LKEPNNEPSHPNNFKLIGFIISDSILWVYLTTLAKRTKKLIQEHSDSSSEIFTDLKVWFKKL
jgi:hypothetical protein